MRADLHLHTCASDGALTPEALVALVRECWIELFSVTDHDTTEGLPGARRAAQELGLRVVPGVELSCGGAVEVHILGYFADVPVGMQPLLSDMREQRTHRLSLMLRKLEQIGIPLSKEELPLAQGGAPGRVHVARALVQKGHASSVADAFSRYLTPGRPGFVPRDKLEPKAAIRAIRACGGIAVLAHPGIIQASASLLPERIRVLKAHGLSGVEAYHPRHTPSQSRQLFTLARREGLLVTGGSDFHGAHTAGMPGDGTQHWQTMREDCLKFLYTIGLDS